MIEEQIINLLSITVFQNELWRYLVFVLIMLLNYPLSKVVIHIINNFLIVWAEKTSFKLDDILIRSINPPITMFIIAATFYVAKSFIEQGVLEDFFNKIFIFLIVIPFVYFLVKFSTEALSYYLKESNKKDNKHLNEAAIDLMTTIIKFALIIVGILVILSNLGYNVSALLAGLGVGGLAFALAAQDILKNFFAGVALVFDKTFNKGERVSFQGNDGIIEDLKLRSTKLRTYDGTLLTIPNAMLADNIVENVTKVPKVKVMTTIGVTYDTDYKKLEKAKKIIEKVVKDHPKTLQEKVFIWFDNFGAYSLDIQVIFYADLKMSDWPDRVYYKDEVYMGIKKEFDKAGIDFAFPTQTIDLEFRDVQLDKFTGKKSRK